MIPTLIEEIDYETLKSDTIAYLKNFTGMDIEFLESDDASLLIEALLYRDMLIRARINAAIRASYLFTATGTDLELIASTYNVQRLIDEDDESLRERCVLSLYQFSTAGARGSYKYHALSVDSSIKQVEILTPTAGTVEIVYYADGDFQNAIIAACSAEDKIPLSDTVIVTQAEVLTFDINLTVEILDGYEIISIRDKIKDAFDTLNLTLGIGDNLPVSKIYDVAHVDGIYKISTNAVNDFVANERQVIQTNIIIT